MLVVLLVSCAFVLTVRGLVAGNLSGAWNGADPAAEFHRLRLIYSFLPRTAVSIMAGAALGFAGAIFQHVLRNPLAEPATLGTSAGAALAVTAATLFAPALLDGGRAWIALAGAAAATMMVMFLVLGKTVSPFTLVLSGLVVNLLCGSMSGVLALFHTQYLNTLFIWSAGSLVQTDWSVVLSLLPQTLAVMAATALMLRPLSVLALDDEGARSLGVPLTTIRLVALAVAVALAAFVTSAVGFIGFIGLAAPAMARLLGQRSLRGRLVWAALIGGSMLWLTDQAVQLVQTIMPDVTTGAATALLGAPMLLWLLPRYRIASPQVQISPAGPSRMPHPFALPAVAALLVLAMIVALDFGKGPDGWHFAGRAELEQVFHWRWPRIVASIAAGAMLAAAGNLLQRLTGNGMASPEVLGVTSGAALGVILLALVVAFPDRPMQVAAAGAGAFVSLVGMLALGRRSSFSPDRLLLTGIALGTLFSAVVTFFMATGDPRLAMLLSWMAGSTYGVTGQDALICASIGVVLIAAVPLLHRWLAILPLGEASSRGLGVDLRLSRLTILLCTAVLAGVPTLIVGPLSFVGLMAPHMARMLGLRRPVPQFWGAAGLGAFIMLLADWLGRNLLFPYQVPAGLFPTFIAAPYFLWLMRRRAA